MRNFTIFLVLLISIASYGQDNVNLDSLIVALEKIDDDSTMVSELMYIGGLYDAKNIDTAIYYYNRALEISIDMEQDDMVATMNKWIGEAYTEKGDYEKAVNYLQKSLKYYEQNFAKGNLQDKHSIANIYNDLGIIHFHQNNKDRAIEYFLKNLEIKEQSYNPDGSLADEFGLARGYNNLGNIFGSSQDYEKALEYFNKSLKIKQNITMPDGQKGDQAGIASCYNNIGSVHRLKGEYSKAIEYLLMSLDINKTSSDKHSLATNFSILGSLYITLSDSSASSEKERNEYLNMAVMYGINGVDLSDELNALPLKKSNARLLINAYSKLGDSEKAAYYLDVYLEIHDTIFDQEKAKALLELETKYQTEKQKQEIENQQLQLGKQDADIKRQNIQRIALFSGFIVMIIIAILIFRSYRLKRRANQILSFQKKEIEAKNRQITNSIRYAKLIQESILPSDETLKKAFTDSMIFFKPRDIVSGDFYWFAEKEDLFMIAVSDCTGHGVPGAFMSMIGNTLLNEIVLNRGVLQPGQILSGLNEGVIKALAQNTSGDNMQDDGMDITICCIDKSNNELTIACANHYALLYFDGEMIRVEGDFLSVGDILSSREPISFTEHKYSISENTLIYLFSDGLIDQFGGSENKKYSNKQLSELLTKICMTPMDEQLKALDDSFTEWKGDNKQTDDVCIVGIKI